MMEKRELAAEGVHSAFLTNINLKTAKNGKDFAVLRFQILGHKTSATALLFLDSAEAFLRGVPGYQGTAFDELQLLGRSAQVSVTHNSGQDDQIFANADLTTIVWEAEPDRPQEPSDDFSKVIVICGTHPKNGEFRTGKYYYRLVGKSEIHTKEAGGKSVYDVVATGIRVLLQRAVTKKVCLRIFSDVKPAVQGLGHEATDSRCSLHWKPAAEIKRLLFRGLRTPYVTKRPVTSVVSGGSDELDELFG